MARLALLALSCLAPAAFAPDVTGHCTPVYSPELGWYWCAQSDCTGDCTIEIVYGPGHAAGAKCNCS